jgi:hypothetical protein
VGVVVDENGYRVNTEYYVCEVDCVDAKGERRLIRLQAWIFGVGKVLCDEAYPAEHDAEWPLEEVSARFQ